VAVDLFPSISPYKSIYMFIQITTASSSWILSKYPLMITFPPSWTLQCMISLVKRTLHHS
jgi:hypothetical protein